MRPFKRALTSVCAWFGGNDPAQEQMPSRHSWLIPGPSFLNDLIRWANPPQPVLATIAVRRPSRRY